MTAVLDTAPVKPVSTFKQPITLVPSDPPVAAHLTREQVEELGDKLKAIYDRVCADRGSANISGGPLLHLMSGNLSFQIEHHLFPDLPSNRYKEIAPEVQALCAEYGIPYTSGPFWKQYLQVLRKINRLALP